MLAEIQFGLLGLGFAFLLDDLGPAAGFFGGCFESEIFIEELLQVILFLLNMNLLDLVIEKDVDQLLYVLEIHVHAVLLLEDVVVGVQIVQVDLQVRLVVFLILPQLQDLPGDLIVFLEHLPVLGPDELDGLFVLQVVVVDEILHLDFLKLQKLLEL